MFHGHHSTSEGDLEGREEDARVCDSSPCQIPAQVDIARVQRLLHSGTLSVIQHKITFSVTIWVVLKHPALQYCVTVDTLSRCLLRNVTAVR